ncbi:MAG TPA: YetF domain-containing protein [Candidatus Acidoferrum sp.]|nr:YetF domain-containing protein [Candidatus Acidoferrum sp.]
MWQLTVPPLELVLRTLIVYFLFLIALRVSGKREIGQFTLFDLTLVLLAANAMQPAITGPDQSIPGAAVIIVTIFGVNRAVAIARRRIPIVKRALEPPATVIGRSGKWIQEALDREGLDDDDLEAALREHGLSSVDDMRLAVLEPDGSISIVPFDGPSVRMRTRRRRYRHQPQR